MAQFTVQPGTGHRSRGAIHELREPADGLPRSATVVAGPDGLTTFALSALAFEPVVKENPDVAQALLKALTARIRSLESEN